MFITYLSVWFPTRSGTDRLGEFGSVDRIDVPYRESAKMPASGARTIRIGRSACCLALLASLPIGCVERRMTIRSEPANALVVLDGQEIGFTPKSVPFEYYGDRQIQLIKDGYETKTINQRVSMPWYQYPPIDFVTEVLWPGKIRDARTYTYQLDPATLVPNEQLLERAAAMREDGRNPPPEALRRARVGAETTAATEAMAPTVTTTPVSDLPSTPPLMPIVR